MRFSRICLSSFKVRAAHDLQVVRKHVHSLLAGLSLPAGHIPDVEIEYFVNNFRGIKCTQMRTLADEYDSKTALKDYLSK
jgi:hypothetical protein